MEALPTETELYNFVKEIDVFSSESYMHDFNFISASIGKLLPRASFDKQIEIAKSCALYQMIAVRDERNYELIRKTPKPEVDFSQKIWVTFHYSSYRIFNSLLISWGVPFKLVADANYITKQGDASLKSYAEIASTLKVRPHDFEIINAEDRNVIFKCLEAIKQGYSLVFYADGNSGVGGMVMNKNNMVKIPFLKSHIYVRKGIATIANLLKIPVNTITLKKNIDADFLDFSIQENIPFPADRKSVIDMTDAMGQIFSNLNDRLLLEPRQWEGWFYYHNFIDFSRKRRKTMRQQETIFNHVDYGIGILPGSHCYLLNKRNLKYNLISKELYDNLFAVIRSNQIQIELPVYTSLNNEV